MAGITIDDIFQNNKSNADVKKVQQKSKLQYIHYSELKPSEDEFYSLKQEDIEKLAYSILMCDGVKQPVTCRKTAPNEYEIISGHKRHAAVKFLVQDGYSEYEKIPCIVENYANDNARHAELILTNFTQRERTSFEKMKEVEQLEQILKKMEESGELERIWKEKNEGGEYHKLTTVELRQLIADVLGISKTQVANFKNISNNLSSSAMDKFENGELSVSAATQLAGMEKEKQEELAQKENLDVKKIKKEKKISSREKELIKKYIIDLKGNKLQEKLFISTLRNEENCTNKAPIIRRILNKNSYSGFSYKEFAAELGYKTVSFLVPHCKRREMSWAAFVRILVEMDQEGYFHDMAKEEPAPEEQEEEKTEQLQGPMNVSDYPEVLPDDYKEESCKMAEPASDTKKRDYYLFDYSHNDYFEKMEKGDVCHFTECANGEATKHWEEGHVIKLESASLKRSFKAVITYIEDGFQRRNNPLLYHYELPGGQFHYRIISFKKLMEES